MPSLFERVTRAVVQQLDSGGDMIASRSIIDSKQFCCYCLVTGKKNVFGNVWYHRTGLQLNDITEIDELDSGCQGPNVAISNQVERDGSVEVTLPIITIGGGLHASQQSSISVVPRSIGQGQLKSIHNRKLKQQLPGRFQEIREGRENLYVVTEVLQNKEAETLKGRRQYSFWSKFNFGHLGSEFKDETKVTVPANQVLGYRVQQLFFHKEGLIQLYFNDRNSFPQKKGDDPTHLGKSLDLGDSRDIEDKVKDMVTALEDLTDKEQQSMFRYLKRCLSEDELLQDAQQRVFEVQFTRSLDMESPVAPLLNSLCNAAGILVEARIEATLDFLDAVMELAEERQLVDVTLEKGTLPQLKDQVERILKQDYNKESSDVRSDPEARTLCALYIVVSILGQLSSTSGSS